MYYYIALLFIAIYLIYHFWGKDFRHRRFASFMEEFTKNLDPKYIELKKDHFQHMHTLVSHDPELRKNKELRILEIGVGTGANFQYYPDGTNLTVIDPNPHFSNYYDVNRSKFPNIKSDKIIVCGGENMDMVESNSIDVVVVTLVLCSVNNVAAVVKQVHRVLVPGGKFFFVEHIKEFSEEYRTRRILQTVLTLSGLWPFFLDGCQLTRDMLADIERSGFSKVDARRLHAPFGRKGLGHVLSPHIIGIATK